MSVQEQQPLYLKIEMPTHVYFTAGIRDFTFNLVKNSTGLGEKWAYRFQLIIDELCNNAIEHGSKTGEIIYIEFHKNNDELKIIVEDSGTADKKMTAEDLHKLVEERKNPAYVNKDIRGRGLAKIVAAWVDSLTFEASPKGGMKVTIIKKLTAPTPDANMPMEDKTHIII